ncbi:hypothetical protein N0V85_001191 [Neurospora sp. IMI 360204]|nr:hypothetical protein N0V85_001191 [Neurospora sp. IMI 360204]
MGTSSDIFATQTAGLRSLLGCGNLHTFDFVEGGVESPPAPGIAALFPNTDYYAYYDPKSPQSILQALDDLSAYLTDEGPFDGVMGFSQGAALASMLISRFCNNASVSNKEASHTYTASSSPFSFAIFICAAAPLCEDSLRSGTIKHLDPDERGGKEEDRKASSTFKLPIPVANIVGRKDPDLAASLRLAGLCQGPSVLLDHGAGHEIPSGSMLVLRQMAECVEEVIAKATLVQ